jgi:hypothetical protein
MAPVSGGLRITSWATISGDSIAIVIGRPLKNFNSGNRNPHWRVKHQARQQWAADILNAIVEAVGVAEAQRLLGPKAPLVGCVGGCTVRRRVVVTRWIPSKRNAIRDTFDNLRSATKELRDALKGLGLIRDDSDRWCAMAIQQAVSSDAAWRTEILIEPWEDTCDHAR